MAMDGDTCDIVTVQPVSIVDHIVLVDDEADMKRILGDDDECEIGGSHPISSQQMNVIESQGKVIESKPGGSASNMLRNLASLGGSCRIVGGRGSDQWGSHFHKSMADRGIDTRYLCVKDGNTGCCCVLTCGNVRTMRPMFESAATFVAKDLQPIHFKGARVLFVSSYCFYHQGLVERMIELGREQGCIIALDMASFEIVRKFSQEITSVLQQVDVCFCNEDEAKEFAIRSDPMCPEEMYTTIGAQYLLENGVLQAVIVTLGEQGCTLFSKLDGPRDGTRVGGYRVENVLDTTGAGDAFSAGFLWGYIKGYDISTCLHIANLTGAAVVQCIGSEISPNMMTWLQERISTYVSC